MGWDKNIEHNLRIGYEIIKNEYNGALDRFKEFDNKLNMLFVFAAGEIAAFGATFHLFKITYFAFIYLGLFFALFLSAVLSILIGLYTKKIEVLETDNFDEPSNYSETEEDFIGGYIAAYKGCIKKIRAKTDKKVKSFNAAIILEILSLATFITCIILNFLI